MLTRDLIFWLSTKKAFTRPIARTGMRLGFARRFIAGETLEDGLQVAAELNARGLQVNMNHLGEGVTDRQEAEAAFDSYRRMLQEIAARKIDGSISIKPTPLGLVFAPDLCRDLTARLAAEAARLNNLMEIDMEDSPTTEATVALFEAVSRQHPNTALAVQSYLYRTEKDLQRLQPLRPKIRLVKGAYREPPPGAFPHKSEGGGEHRRPRGRRAARPLGVPDDSRGAARLAGEARARGLPHAGLHPLRHRVALLLHAPPGRASRPRPCRP